MKIQFLLFLTLALTPSLASHTANIEIISPYIKNEEASIKSKIKKNYPLEFKIPFEIDQTADEFISIVADMDLYKIHLKPNCELPSIPHMYESWAAYVVLEKGVCDENSVIRNLRNHGSDAIFAYYKGHETVRNFYSNGINIPVFALGEDFSGFFQIIEDTIKEHIISDEGSIRLHVDLDQVILYSC